MMLWVNIDIGKTSRTWKSYCWRKVALLLCSRSWMYSLRSEMMLGMSRERIVSK